jgi:hypothetical protein
MLPQTQSLNIRITCDKCKTATVMQANFAPNLPLKQGNVPFPQSNILQCPSCKADIDVANIRLQVEGQTGKKVV